MFNIFIPKYDIDTMVRDIISLTRYILTIITFIYFSQMIISIYYSYINVN